MTIPVEALDRIRHATHALGDEHEGTLDQVPHLIEIRDAATAALDVALQELTEPNEPDDVENECPNCGDSFNGPPGSNCPIAEAHADERRDDRPGPVILVGDHRQSCDGPFVSGPFPNYAAARQHAVDQYLSGEWDAHGYTFEYREPRS